MVRPSLMRAMETEVTIAEQNKAAEPAQQFGTAGIAPMARASAVTRFFMGVVAFAERLRGMVRFDSVDDLLVAMADDVARARSTSV